MTDTQRWQWMVIGSGFFILLYLLAPILTPFVVAALLAYIGDPLADRLEAWGLRRTLAVVVVFVVLSTIAMLLLMVLLPMLERQIILLVNKLPVYVVRLKEVLLPLFSTLSTDGKPLLDWEGLSANIGDYLKGAGNIAGKTLGYLSKSGLVLVGWVANLVLIPVVAFYLLRDWDRLVIAVNELLPRRIEPIINRLARECDEVLGAFLRGQMMVMLSLGVIYSTGLWMVGLDLALLIGMIAGVVSFVPYLG
ncbi:MAG: AI-2E family transporter, partial [Gammaproteobacteria bacterium]|nr:AI-2E family transporter [Gammaproteobacteria bacterium]